jgi:hypothetical protein
LAHGWPGITVNHYIKIKATELREKRFVSLTPRFSAVRSGQCALNRFSDFSEDRRIKNR